MKVQQTVEVYNRDGKKIDSFAVEMLEGEVITFDKVRELMSCDYVTFVDRIGVIHGFRMEHVAELKIS